MLADSLKVGFLHAGVAGYSSVPLLDAVGWDGMGWDGACMALLASSLHCLMRLDAMRVLCAGCARRYT